MPKASKELSPNAVLIGTFLVFLVPFVLVMLFPTQLDPLIDKSQYLAFHNLAETFSIMVSFCVFGIGWYTYDQSKDQRALFLAAAFLGIGLLDLMHTLSNVSMPAFITPNSTNKSTQFWITARLFDASALLYSAFLNPDRQRRWLTKPTVMTAVLVAVGAIFTAVTFFPDEIPATAVKGLGLTPLKRYLEFLVIALLFCSYVAYWKKLARSGERSYLYFLAGFMICIFSEGAFASYKMGFDTFNVLGHLYKVAAYYLVYKAIFATAVQKPYLELSDANDNLRRLNRLYTVLSETNKAIGRAATRDALFREICKVAVDCGGFKMAWVGIIDEESSLVTPVAWHGRNEGFLEKVTVSVEKAGPASCPTRSAILDGELKICSDIMCHPQSLTWRAEAQRWGYLSAAAIPLRSDGATIGSLTLYAGERDYFNGEMLNLLPQMSADISFALDNLAGELRRRAAEQALQEETLERLAAVESLNQNNQMLIQQSRLAAMGEMINNIAHQWRQPLNNIGLIIQELPLLYDVGELSREQLNLRVETAMTTVFHMSNTIDDFRNFLRPDKKKVPFSVSESVTRTLSLIADSFKNLGIEVVVKVNAIPEIIGCPNEFSQVLLNLLANSRDAFLERRGDGANVIEIAIFDGGEKLVVTIADNAGGIPDAIIDRIFEPYFTTKGPEKGTGIGLYMSKNIIDNNMRGRLSVQNSGDGAEFRIELPLKGLPLEQGNSAAASDL